MYVEIWWVVRSPTHYTVQKRKGFNVTSPKCTFDTTNNRYASYQHSIIVQQQQQTSDHHFFYFQYRFFPYAIADSEKPGTYLDNSVTP